MAGSSAACDLPNQESLTTLKAHDVNTKLTDSELEAAIQAKLNRSSSFSGQIIYESSKLNYRQNMSLHNIRYQTEVLYLPASAVIGECAKRCTLKELSFAPHKYSFVKKKNDLSEAVD